MIQYVIDFFTDKVTFVGTLVLGLVVFAVVYWIAREVKSPSDEYDDDFDYESEVHRLNKLVLHYQEKERKRGGDFE